MCETDSTSGFHVEVWSDVTDDDMSDCHEVSSDEND